MTNHDFVPLSRPDYFRSLIDDINHTKPDDRVILTTMTFDPKESVIDELMQTLNAAAKRGVHVRLAVDAFPFILENKTKPGPLWFSKKIPQNPKGVFGQRLESLNELEASGGQTAIINRPTRRFSVPHAGRSHIKIAVINNNVYAGGCNLALPHQIDLMIRWQDTETADWLEKQIQSVMQTGRVRTSLHDNDIVRALDEKTDLLLDSGVPGQSIIYDHTLAIIDDAAEWIFLTCQFFPGGQTGKRLEAAHKRGVNIRIVYGHPRHHGSEALGHYAYNARERARLPGNFFVHRMGRDMAMLHAKVLATDKGAIVGSHNLTAQGVRLGTAEIALIRRDEDFAQAVSKNLHNQLLQAGMKF